MKLLEGKTNIFSAKRLKDICENRHSITKRNTESNIDITASIAIKDLIRLGDYYISALLKAHDLPKYCILYITDIIGNIAKCVVANGKLEQKPELIDSLGTTINCKPYHIEAIDNLLIVSEYKIAKSLQIEKLVIKVNKHAYTIERDIDRITLLDKKTILLEGTLTVNSSLQPTIGITWVTSEIDLYTIQDIIRKFKGYEEINFYR